MILKKTSIFYNFCKFNKKVIINKTSKKKRLKIKKINSIKTLIVFNGFYFY